MKVSEEERLRLRLMTQYMRSRRACASRSALPKATLHRAFWCLYPLAFFYAWRGILW